MQAVVKLPVGQLHLVAQPRQDGLPLRRRVAQVVKVRHGKDIGPHHPVVLLRQRADGLPVDGLVELVHPGGQVSPVVGVLEEPLVQQHPPVVGHPVLPAAVAGRQPFDVVLLPVEAVVPVPGDEKHFWLFSGL